MIIDGKKEFIYDKCKECIHADFQVAQGLHPDYGWYVQICKAPNHRCKPTKAQLSLFDD